MIEAVNGIVRDNVFVTKDTIWPKTTVIRGNLVFDQQNVLNEIIELQKLTYDLIITPNSKIHLILETENGQLKMDLLLNIGINASAVENEEVMKIYYFVKRNLKDYSDLIRQHWK